MRRLWLGLACPSTLVLGLAVLPFEAGAAEWFFGEDGFSEGSQPRVTMDGAGETVVVYQASEGFGSAIRASLRPPGGDFSRVAVSGEGHSVEAPDVAIDPAGDVVVVWQEGEGPGDARIYESFRPSGGSFGVPVPISAVGATAPAVAMDGRGDVTVVWLLNDKTNEIVQAATAPRDGSFSAPVALSGDGGDASSVEVAMDAANDVVASWTRTVSGVTQFEDALARAGGGFPAPDGQGDGSVIGESESGSIKAPVEPPVQHVVLNGLGEALAVWRTSGGEVRVARLGAGSSSFGAPVTLGNSTARPSLAMNEEGEAVIGWPVAVGMDVATAPVGGSFGTPENVISVDGGTPEEAELTIAPGGTVALVWLMAKEGSGDEWNEVAEEATVRPPGGVFEPLWHQYSYAEKLTVAANSLELASDADGDVFGIWQEGTDLADRVESMLYDGGPVLGQVAVPATGLTGQPLSFSTTTPVSVWAPLESITWDFGDGASASGVSTTHTYTHPGVYHLTLTATSTQGGRPARQENVGTAVTRTITITSPPGQPSVSLPVVTNVHESHRVWRESRRLARLSRSARRLPVGTTFSFSLNEPASVAFKFTEPAHGRKIGKACIAQTKTNEHKHRCTRTVTVGTLTFSARAGTNKMRFEGLISKHKKLKPGSYTLLVTATASGKRSATRMLRFTIAIG